MDEARVKANVLTQIRNATGRGKKPVVTAEFSLGTSGVRADLALLREQFLGIEIKTERDTLRRLPSQMAAYSRYFERVILVVAPCHLKNIDLATLHGASVWACEDDGRLVEKAPGTENQIPQIAYLDLMTLEDRRRLSRELGAQTDEGYLAPKAETHVRRYFEKVFEARYGLTSSTFWRGTTRRTIHPSDLSLLSRFAPRREQMRLFAAEKQERWRLWVEQQQSVDAG